ncbi:MAG: RluA family pseudouridine synthase [Acholeplasmatales bacterium]|nr:RluA family pseudouridine synthase [Acholeplasmatales bacterium]
MEFKIENEYDGVRIDKVLSNLISDKSRMYILKCIEDGNVKVNGEVITKPSYKLKTNDLVELKELEAKSLDVEAENLNLDIIYQDEDVAVINKPKGMVVHPGSGVNSGTLVNGLLYEMDDLSEINGVVRPGIVHRIDKDTTGLLMVAKNDKAALSLMNQLKDHKCNRIYHALVYGVITENRGRINAPIARDPNDRKKMAVVKDGKEAITNFKVLKRFKEFTYIECKLETGRTHQIRVHLEYIGHPLVGDKTYGRRKTIGDQGQFLHAKTIGFVHPTTNKWMEFDSELPEYFKEFMDNLE